MMVNVDQLTNSLTSLPQQPHFIRHAMFGLLAVFVSFVILHMQQPQQNEPNNTHPWNDSMLMSFLLRLIINPAVTAIATLLTTLWTFILRMVGTTLGVGLGLGLAGHIYDSLDEMHNHHKNKNEGEKQRCTGMTAKVPATPFATSEDPNSYHSLMRSAGYHVDPSSLRAQMVRGERATVATQANGGRSEQVDSTGQHHKPSIYKFEKGETAFTRMKSMWPNLSPVINESLAKLTEFVLRDYVASWYGKVDENVAYVDPASESRTAPSSDLKGSATSKVSPSNQTMMNDAPKERRATLANPPEVTSFTHHSSGSSVSSYSSRPPPPSQSLSKSLSIGSDEEQHNSNRTMVLTTVGTLPSPFIDSLYTSFTYLLGTLATRASENVNVLELLLLHLPHVLGENLKVYRELKGAALEKKMRRQGVAGTNRPGSKRGKDAPMWRQSSSINAASTNGAVSSSAQHDSNSEDDVSEIAIIREYLLAGRLHRAVTFGLDVPSLLFADPLAKDCPPSGSYNEIKERLNKSGHVEEDSVLEDRLLSSGSTLVAECELDYARVLASKIAKLVVPKSEIDSSIIRTMLVEMLASCVLVPVMGCFVPDSVNGWIITGLQLALEDGESDNTRTETGTVTTAYIDRSESAASLTGTNQCDGDMDEILEAALGGVDNMSDVILAEGSITSEVEDALFGDTDDASKSGYLFDQCTKSEQLVTLLSMSLIELRNFVDFDDCRYAKEHDQDVPVDWDNPRSREAVRHLVLIIEAALLLGSRPERKKKANVRGESINDLSEFVETTLEEAETMDGDDFEVDIDVVSESIAPVPSFHRLNTISAVLMEVTGDLDTFEKIASTADQRAQFSDDDSLQDPEANFTPKSHELSTLRTLIAAWLHTGQACRVLSIIGKNYEAILRPYYYKNAFTRRENYFAEFTKLLKQLEGVEILVDTTAVLASQCLLAPGSGFENFERKLIETIHREGVAPKMIMANEKIDNEGTVLGSGLFKQVGSVRANFVQNRDRLARLAQESFQFGQRLEFDDLSKSSSAYNYHQNSIPIYLQYTRNKVFASSLRTERQRRKESWHKETMEREKLDLVCRSKGVTEKDQLMHRELHHLSRFFYSNTCELMVEPCSVGEAGTQSESAANITVKAIAPRRKIEVPDEDSSFLLRAQPRPLKPAAIHRDQNAANLTCKIYVAMYEEPAMHPKTKRFYGGRCLRQCLLRYYPNDKTASVSIANDLTVFDRRIGQPSVKHVLTEEFQTTRHSCMKVASSGSLLASPTMDPNDFSVFPRAGKALDFMYRTSFFEKPMVELSGKKFVIHDASALLHHRADASCMELSDASLTAAIILRGSSGLNICYDENTTPRSFSIKISDDGSPLVLLRANAPGKDTKDEARPYRPSFIRAALLVKSAKQEAQAQCLSFCIKNGSARSSTKIKSDAWLQPTLNLLHYANSRRKEEQSALLRDLHIGMNHVDRAQLCRNGLLNPRYPTVLRGLTVKVVGAVEVKAPTNVDLLGTPTLVLFKIHCTAITEFIGDDDDDFSSGDGASKSRYFREEWTVLRSLRDFSIFHKHIKSQVAPTEHSAGAGARLVGAATAALTIVGGSQGAKKVRGQLVPSLSKATQAGTLGLSSKRVIERRKKLLDEYLKYLVAPNSLLSRCPELLNFLGAYTSIFPLKSGDALEDEFGREEVSRAELDTEKLKVGIVAVKIGTEQKRPDATPKLTNKRVATTEASQKVDSLLSETSPEASRNMPPESPEVSNKKQTDVTRRIAMIRSQEVCLKDVRRSAFRLLRNIFDLDSASFFRSRVISVIRTMSVALTNAQDFHLMLFRTHIKYMNGEWVSGWIFYFIDLFWPDGVFYTKGPDLTEKEKAILKLNSKMMLEKALPLQLKTVLGKHSDEGLDMLHEMLQNKLVLKSIAYMLLDLVWAEVFPELSDFVTGAASLEKEI